MKIHIVTFSVDKQQWSRQGPIIDYSSIGTWHIMTWELQAYFGR